MSDVSYARITGEWWTRHREIVTNEGTAHAARRLVWEAPSAFVPRRLAGLIPLPAAPTPDRRIRQARSRCRGSAQQSDRHATLTSGAHPFPMAGARSVGAGQRIM